MEIFQKIDIEILQRLEENRDSERERKREGLPRWGPTFPHPGTEIARKLWPSPLKPLSQPLKNREREKG